MRKQRTDELKGYKIDFVKNTLTLNYKFADAAFNDYGSPEYVRMKAILADFPQLKVIVEAGRKITTTRKTKRLTYDNMKTYIEQFDNAEELKAMFEQVDYSVQALYRMFEKVQLMSKPLASPYKYVQDWFKAQFPNYKECPTPGKVNHKVSVVDAPDTSNYKPKDNEAEDDIAA